MILRTFPFGDRRRTWTRTGILLSVTAFPGLAALAAVLAVMSGPSEMTQTAFAAENRAAMVQMSAGMDIQPSGDVDRDFATMMIAHHQAAIAMAAAELRHGRHEQLRRLAQGIIVEQQQEIAAMRAAREDVALPVSGAICTSLSASTPRQALAAWAKRGGAAN